MQLEALTNTMPLVQAFTKSQPKTQTSLYSQDSKSRNRRLNCVVTSFILFMTA